MHNEESTGGVLDGNPTRPQPRPTPALREADGTKAGPEWQAVERVLQSSGFVRSTLLSNFLRYVCERKLQGRVNELSEQQIGIHAFGRSPAYNPGEDNIVRNYARILRQRLDSFYAHEGSGEPLRIAMPRGSYVPQFHPNEIAASPHQGSQPPIPNTLPTVPTTESDAGPAQARSIATGKHVLFAAFVLALVAVAAFSLRKLWTLTHPDVYVQFWNQVLPSDRPTVVVLADSGIGILQDLTGKHIHLHEYISGNTDEVAVALAKQYPGSTFGPDRYRNLTSTADVHSLMNLVQLPQFAAAKVLVRSAHDVQLDDLSRANSIIIGGPRANPWVELYEPLSDFRLEIPDQLRGSQLDRRVILNKHPKNGEAESYSNSDTAEGHVNHSILSFLPGVDGHGHALLFQGGNMGATQAAADFATDPAAMKPILVAARRSNGSLRRFEVLLETRVVGAGSPTPTVVLVHYGE